MAPHSSTLAWKIPWMAGPDGLQSMGSQGVGHGLVTEQQQHDLKKVLGFSNGYIIQSSNK